MAQNAAVTKGGERYIPRLKAAYHGEMVRQPLPGSDRFRGEYAYAPVIQLQEPQALLAEPQG